MIRRLLIIFFASLIWTVQTVDATVDHAPSAAAGSSAELAVTADDGCGADHSKVQGITCGAGCICHVFHHAFMDDAVQLAQPVVGGEVFAHVDSASHFFAIAPPTRPPLV